MLVDGGAFDNVATNLDRFESFTEVKEVMVQPADAAKVGSR